MRIRAHVSHFPPRTLGYDDAAQITGFTHTRSGAAQTSFNQSFGYDDLGQLRSNAQSTTSYSYSYDASGNRVLSVVGAASYAQTIAPTSNRLTQSQGASGSTSFSYDNAGNMLTDGAASYTYSDRGRMASATIGANTVAYKFNGLDQRVSKSGPTAVVPSGAAYYAYDEAGQLIGEYDASVKPGFETIYLGTTPVAVLKQTGSASNSTLQVVAYNVWADHLDTPRVVTRSSDQAIVWRWDSAEAFGATAPNQNPNALGVFSYNQRFPGQLVDLETGNFYNWYRDYRAGVGRYVQSDPIGLDGGINTYAYVEGNPVSNVDPDGLMGRGGMPNRPSPVPPGGVRFGGGGADPGFCGSGWNQSFVPDSIFGLNLRDACQKHDACYEQCGANKLQCDLQFGSDIRGACQQGGFASGRGSICGSVAVDYQTAVLIGGDSAFNKAQEKCTCKAK